MKHSHRRPGEVSNTSREKKRRTSESQCGCRVEKVLLIWLLNLNRLSLRSSPTSYIHWSPLFYSLDYAGVVHWSFIVMNFLCLRRAVGTGHAFKRELERNSVIFGCSPAAGETCHGELPWWILASKTFSGDEEENPGRSLLRSICVAAYNYCSDKYKVRYLWRTDRLQIHGGADIRARNSKQAEIFRCAPSNKK